ncbi:MAG TPA: hypothetical protein VMT75_10800 [Candidatus Saccharimonadales bacterium]|nr:hypothetical protein [Candidatus Saccharimonadales bacterium]
MNAEDDATPLELVVSVSVFDPPVKVPLAPDDGAVKVTLTPLTPVPPLVTVTDSTEENWDPTWMVCPDPPATAMASEGDEDPQLENR